MSGTGPLRLGKPDRRDLKAGAGRQRANVIGSRLLCGTVITHPRLYLPGPGQDTAAGRSLRASSAGGCQAAKPPPCHPLAERARAMDGWRRGGALKLLIFSECEMRGTLLSFVCLFWPLCDLPACATLAVPGSRVQHRDPVDHQDKHIALVPIAFCIHGARILR